MKSNRAQAIPEGYSAVTPWIISKNTIQLIEFVEKAFDAKCLAIISNEDGSIGHAEVQIGDSIVMMFDVIDDQLKTPSFLRLYVEDGNKTVQQALEAGGTIVTEMTSLAFGDRVGRVCDPFGNIWWIQERVENLELEEIEKRSQERNYIDAMKYVQNSLIQKLTSE
jgi:uncharacterized glyoxalase superfamily protein PhnB